MHMCDSQYKHMARVQGRDSIRKDLYRGYYSILRERQVYADMLRDVDLFLLYGQVCHTHAVHVHLLFQGFAFSM